MRIDAGFYAQHVDGETYWHVDRPIRDPRILALVARAMDRAGLTSTNVRACEIVGTEMRPTVTFECIRRINGRPTEYYSITVDLL